MKLALITASWHLDLVNVAKSSCVQELAKSIDVETAVDDFNVPGSLEIPLFAQKLAQTGRYTGIIAFGLIVDGGIYRHEFVGQAVIDGIMRVQLDTGVPILSCVLTPQRFHEHDDHLKFFKEHLVQKGREVAQSCVMLLRALPLIGQPEAKADRLRE